MSRWKEYFLTLIFAVLFAVIVRSFVITAYKVPTGAMQPTLKPGDFIFSSRVSYGVHAFPSRGDIVAYTYPNNPRTTYVKRVVGIPGDHIQVKAGRLYINDQPLRYTLLAETEGNPNPQAFELFEESMDDLSWKVIIAKDSEDTRFGPIVVPPGEVFMLGDNRDVSDDSRYWGPVPVEQVTGRVIFIWLSFDWQKKWADGRYPSVRWERVFSPVH